MYLDPNFGSIIIQLFVALIAGFGAYIIVVRKKIASIIFRKEHDGGASAGAMRHEVKNEKEGI